MTLRAVLLALLVGGSLFAAALVQRAERRTAAATARADSLATVALVERARADGWEVRAADQSRDLLEQLAAADSQSARLARELEAARAQAIALTELVATSEGAVSVPAEVAEPAVETSATDSAWAMIEDGPLTARVAYYPPVRRFGLDWSIRIRVQLVHAEAADGRLVVFARATDPRVTLEVPRLEWHPPPAPPGPSRLRWAIGGAIVGAVLWELGR